ncbi:GNAT family N-acetyltransferase [Sneathiella sp.]|uniref:GNAT family N-acetyltransferase n=1 Tax=Sneathiella sp. TaxID=1964365 RepID=UPI002FE235F2
MPIKRPPQPTEEGLWPVTVTFLEMREKAATPAPPPPAMSHAVIRAEAPTLSFYRFLYNTTGRDWGWMDRRNMSDVELDRIINAAATEIYVLYLRGVPAGFAEINTEDMPDVIDLAYFGILPEFIGMGLGPWLLDNIVDLAWSKGPARLTVNTCTLDHPKALLMYQHAGFKPIRQRHIEIEPLPDL